MKSVYQGLSVELRLECISQHVVNWESFFRHFDISAKRDPEFFDMLLLDCPFCSEPESLAVHTDADIFPLPLCACHNPWCTAHCGVDNSVAGVIAPGCSDPGLIEELLKEIECVGLWHRMDDDLPPWVIQYGDYAGMKLKDVPLCHVRWLAQSNLLPDHVAMSIRECIDLESSSKEIAEELSWF